MMKNFFLVLLAFITAACSAQHEPLVNKKIAQMVMVGFSGTEINKNSQIVKDVQNLGIGGIIIYEYDGILKSRPRNIKSQEQLIKLTESLQAYSNIPLFIGIDEEGGRVSRLKKCYGFLPTVSPQYLGEIHNNDSSVFYAQRIAKSCKSVGVNINFAPSVDVNVNPRCPVIGALGRSYSENPEQVSNEATIFIQEHWKQKVFCSIKHFPGHGSAKSDSHKGFTNVSDSWIKDELIPYQQLLNSPLPVMVMTAHVFNNNIDSVYPATLSKPTIDILRKQIGFQGVLLSDDMMMKAIENHFGFEESIKKAINAGVDVLLFSNNIDHTDSQIAKKAILAIQNMVDKGLISEERIDESYQRIMKYKAMLNN